MSHSNGGHHCHVCIERLPLRRASNETKELMNCKSCRRRKIKCNRVKPSCEACQVFRCDCIYDAIPKKRGPKPDSTDVSKRCKGFGQKQPVQPGKAFKEPKIRSNSSKEKQPSSTSPDSSSQDPGSSETTSSEPSQPTWVNHSLSNSSLQDTVPLADRILNIYFDRLHEKPFFILDQRATRQRTRDGMLPRFLANAIFAVTIRLIPGVNNDYHSALGSSREFAEQSRMEIDVDEPTIDHLQSLLLLAMANYQIGKGKKSYMLLSHATTMAIALGLHNELPADLRVSNVERESRRKLFWTCYLMDRYYACGSERPSFVTDESIRLRLPAWQPIGSPLWLDGEYFTVAPAFLGSSTAPIASKGSGAALVEVSRILGDANCYLAAGGFRSDSFFPWNAQSRLSRIRTDLDQWASSTQEVFHSVPALFGRSESTSWILSKLIYHLVHCLIYRPFLPLNSDELHRAGENHLWHLEVVNCCFQHANAIAELVEIGASAAIDWPPCVAYCISNAATIHVHGAGYAQSLDDAVYSRSTEQLSHEIDTLHRLAQVWLGAQHQLQLLQAVCTRHSQLLSTLDDGTATSLFQSGDFYKRYSGVQIDPAYVTLRGQDAHGSDLAGVGRDDGPGQTSEWMQPILSRGRAQSQPSTSKTAEIGKEQRRLTHPDVSGHDYLTNRQQTGQEDGPAMQTASPSKLPNSLLQREDGFDSSQTQAPFATADCFNLLPYNLSFDQQPITSGLSPHEGDTNESFMQDVSEQDPFLALLEQMASNESACAGMNELDYFLSKTRSSQ